MIKIAKRRKGIWDNYTRKELIQAVRDNAKYIKENSKGDISTSQYEKHIEMLKMLTRTKRTKLSTMGNISRMNKEDIYRIKVYQEKIKGDSWVMNSDSIIERMFSNRPRYEYENLSDVQKGNLLKLLDVFNNTIFHELEEKNFLASNQLIDYIAESNSNISFNSLQDFMIRIARSNNMNRDIADNELRGFLSEYL